jgi:hypothetical protein
VSFCQLATAEHFSPFARYARMIGITISGEAYAAIASI